MTRLRFFHHCKIVLLSTVIIAAAAGICGLFWLNQRGFAGEWGKRIEAELSERGIYAKFKQARYSPLRGILVHQAVFYADQGKKEPFAWIPDLRIDIDRSKALRGELVLRELVLRDADIEIPLVSNPDKPAVAHLKKLSGSVTVDRQGRFILREGTGELAGMQFHLEAELDEFKLGHFAGHARGSDEDDSRARFIHALFAELSNWSLTGSRPPQLGLRITGNFSRPSSILTSFTLNAAQLTRNAYTMEKVHVAGEFLGRHLNLDTFQFTNGAGRLVGSAGYDLRTREGRYEIRESTIHLFKSSKHQSLLGDCFDYHALDVIESSQAPDIVGRGTFRVPPDGTLNLSATGKLTMPGFSFKGTRYERLETEFSFRRNTPYQHHPTEFSWLDGNMFLRNLDVTHREGSLKGKIMIRLGTIQYSANSTLPISAFSHFIAPGSGLARIIDRTTFTKASTVHLVADGTIPLDDALEWSSSGTAEVTNIAFNGVPLKSVKAEYSMTPVEHIFSGIEGEFDYTNYPLRRRHGGLASATVQVERISHDHLANTTRIVKLSGTAWPGPVLRLFAPKAATHVEESYRFRSPPTFLTDGLVGHPKPARGDHARDTRPITDVATILRSTGTTSYTFLNRELALEDLAAEIRYHQNGKVDVTGLRCRTFGGPVGGFVHIDIKPGEPSPFNGDIHWTRLRFADIGDTYDFGKADQGYVTGRFEFRGTSGDVRTLNGTGAIGLEHGHLFFVPVLGPLSPILGDILGDKRSSHEEARDASCTFAVKDGVFLTRDFLTSTPSTVFTGDGSIDLRRKTIDMTIRMNARGLFGLITLPLRPFNGLFQFRGQGTLESPVWKSAPFVAPPDGKDDALFRKPGRAVIIPGRAEIVPER